mgnify:CR=1 FL=1
MAHIFSTNLLRQVAKAMMKNLIGKALGGVKALLVQQRPELLVPGIAAQYLYMSARQAVFRDELRVLPAQADAAVGGRRAEAPQALPVDAVLVLPVVGD